VPTNLPARRTQRASAPIHYLPLLAIVSVVLLVVALVIAHETDQSMSEHILRIADYGAP